MPFDRKTFDPLNNSDDMQTVNRLRALGRFRRQPSSGATQGFRWFTRNTPKNARPIFLDLGCGDSPDYLHAKKRGFKVHRMDLIRPWIFVENPRAEKMEHFILGDIAERLPFEAKSIDLIICQAVIDLIEPNARIGFYQEVRRILKPQGLFICYAQTLAAGWGFVPADEIANLRTLFPSVVACDKIWRCHTVPQSRYVQKDGTYNLPMEAAK